MARRLGVQTMRSAEALGRGPLRARAIAPRHRFGSIRRIALAALLLAGCAMPAGGIHARLGFSEASGLRIVEVPAEGPAARAGLREGDRVIAIDGEPVRSLALAEIRERLRGRVGSEVELEISRDGEVRTIAIRRAMYERRGRRGGAPAER